MTLYDDPARADPAAMDSALAAAVTPRTRAVALAWVHSGTGVKLPAARLARAVHARAPRALVCLDAVHGFGAEVSRPAALGCDVLVSGGHKWLMGPRGTGIVWATPAAWQAVAPTVPSFDGDGFAAWFEDRAPRTTPPGPFHSPGGYHAFEHRWALAQAFAFHGAIGPARIADRIHALRARLHDGLRSVPGVHLVTPAGDLAAGIVCFDVDGTPAAAFADALTDTGIVASTTPYAEPHVRLGTTITLDERDVDAAVRTVRRLAYHQPGAGRALERADDVARDPAAVEVALLGLDASPSTVQRVHPARVERDVLAQGLVAAASGRG